jgi:exosortase
MHRDAGNGILEEFRIEFLDCWQRLPNKGFFLVLVVAWLALFQFMGNSTLGYVRTHSLLYWMYTAYNPMTPEPDPQDAHPEPSPEAGDAHGNIVPLVVLALFWWKRKELLAAELRAWWPGLLLVVLGLFFHLLGFAVQQPRISIVGLFVGLYGLTGLAWGPRWLTRSFFPFFLFVFSVPLGSLAEPITFRLRLLVSYLVEIVCLPIGVNRIGTKLLDPSGHYEYEVAAACSGIRSLIATVALAMILAFFSFDKWWKRALVIASAFPLAVMGNLLRMLTIVIAAEIGGQSAGTYVHNGGPAGIFSLLPYVPVFIGLLALEHYLRDNKPAMKGPQSSAVSSTAAGQSEAFQSTRVEAKRS